MIINVMPCSNYLKKARLPIVLLLLISCLIISSSEAATQDFSISFSSINSHNPLLIQSYGSMQALVAYRADAISASAMLLFIPASTNTSYVLAAYLSAAGGNDTGAILWIANRDSPVSGDFSLSLNQASGNLVLLDGDGTLAWSSNNSVTGRPVSMDLKTDFSGSIPIGTLFLSDAGNNNTLWQSTDHPTNTLVTSQSLEPGASLVSWMSMSNPSVGQYRLVMEASGLALYFNGSSLPYWAWSYYGHNNSFGVTHTCESLIRAYMDPVGHGLELQTTTVAAPVNVNNCTIDNEPRVYEVYFDDNSRSNSSSNENMTFLQLFSNGSLIANTLGSGRWNLVFDLFGDNKCLIPNYCGPYGVCTAPSTCACPSSSEGPFPKNDRAEGCPPTHPPTCAPGSKHELLTLDGVDYVANKYSLPLTDFSTSESCQNACLESCSCLAAFWHSHTNSCFHSSDMSGLQNTLNSSFTAFVKAERPAKSNQLLVAGLVSGGVAVLLITSCLVAGACTYKRRRTADLQAKDGEDPFLNSVPGLPRYTYKDLEAITNGFSEQMGKGGFGVVYAGVLQAGTRVAVKRLENSRQGTKEFRAEVVILGALHHYNLVSLIGFCAEGSQRLLVYECMANGSLDEWLARPALDWKHRFNIALGAARGLAYLHGECKNTILHLDIKPENILLDEEFVAKVADFGLSTLMGRNETHVITTMRGTPGYLAPEWLAEGFEVSAKCDVFSFGKVLMEVLSGRRNLDTSLQDGAADNVYFPSWLYHHITQQQGQGPGPVDLSEIAKVKTPEEMRQARLLMKTAFLCVLENPSQRPSMERVVHMLEGRVPELENLELSHLFQGLQFALRMPLPSLADTRIEEALAPLYQTLSSELDQSSVPTNGGVSSVTWSSDISAR